MSLSGAELLIYLLEKHGIKQIFGIPGGSILPFYDCLQRSQINHVLARHEQGAAFMAQGWARSTGEIGVCVACSGPGTTNLITAIADAQMDSIGILAITGQVPKSQMGRDAFQETDTFTLMASITKHHWLVEDAEALIDIIPNAIEIIRGPRPGPVIIDIPKDVQADIVNLDFDQIDQQLTASKLTDRRPYFKPSNTLEMDLNHTLQLLCQAKRPLLLIGGGVVSSGAQHQVRQFIEQTNIGLITTMMGLGVLNRDHPAMLGMIGMHGDPLANMSLVECDLLLALGTRFDERAIGKPSTFCPQANIIHVDIDPIELGKMLTPSLAICCDMGKFLNALTMKINYQFDKNGAFKNPVRTTDNRTYRSNTAIPSILTWLRQLTDERMIFITDVGQHQMWAAQALSFSHPRQWITSGGLGTMGFGLPTAIGAACAKPHHTIVCISGDGSLMMNLQELDTLAALDLNVKIIVLHNNHLGLVRQQQVLFYQSNLVATQNQRCLDFAKIAKAMGIASTTLSDNVEFSADLRVLQSILKTAGPHLIEYQLSAQRMVFPTVAAGNANHQMILE